MIDYHTFHKIKDLYQNDQLTIAQIARTLLLDDKTVKKWVDKERYEPSKKPPRACKLDTYKSSIRELLNRHDYTAVQIFQRIRAEGYNGKYTRLCDYIRSVRPPKKPAFLSLAFAPGECAQVDFGSCGTVQVGNNRRRLSVFVMVLCYSRMIYLEFTLKESLEHFLSCHCNAFEFFGGVTQKVMVDNCKVAILKHSRYGEVVPHPRYADMASHYGFQIKACGIQKGNEKGRVERGIGYVRINFLNGLEISIFTGLNDMAGNWRDTIANVRIHGTTKQRPIDLFQNEKKALTPLPVHPYDCAIVKNLYANSQFDVLYQSNRYSVPAFYASNKNLIGRIYPDQICIYHKDKRIACHPRSYERNISVKNLDHEKELLKQRRNAREQKILQNFLALTHKAEDYYRGPAEKKPNPRHHLAKIMALAEIYGQDNTARAIEEACQYQAFSSDYIANLLEQRQRILPPASPLHLTRKQDLLDLEIQPPDLNIYNLNQNKSHHKETNDEQQKQ